MSAGHSCLPGDPCHAGWPAEAAPSRWEAREPLPRNGDQLALAGPAALAGTKEAGHSHTESYKHPDVLVQRHGHSCCPHTVLC